MAEVSSTFYAFLDSLAPGELQDLVSLLEQLTSDINQQLLSKTLRYNNLTTTVNSSQFRELKFTDQSELITQSVERIEASPILPTSPDLQGLWESLKDSRTIYDNLAQSVGLAQMELSQVELANQIRELRSQLLKIRLYRNIVKFRLGI